MMLSRNSHKILILPTAVTHDIGFIFPLFTTSHPPYHSVSPSLPRFNPWPLDGWPGPGTRGGISSIGRQLPEIIGRLCTQEGRRKINFDLGRRGVYFGIRYSFQAFFPVLQNFYPMISRQTKKGHSRLFPTFSLP